jgi:hypothetical protein
MPDATREPAAPVTLAVARERLAHLRPRITQFVRRRADLAELRIDLATHGESRLGGRAELKGLEARLHADLEDFSTAGAQIRGYAPLLLDWLGERDGVQVWWCWLEGERDIGWYHRLDCGFPGRRPV